MLGGKVFPLKLVKSSPFVKLLLNGWPLGPSKTVQMGRSIGAPDPILVLEPSNYGTPNFDPYPHVNCVIKQFVPPDRLNIELSWQFITNQLIILA